ncbi:MAG: hypothetical protein HKP61_20935 [Dactylosporangium sp.]|nr:hypothetical protein [Dactylosporangium sp.]NNJ63348.1 hypothetical protein [Dactylosporangium sp.]
MTFSARAYYLGGHRDQPAVLHGAEDVDTLVDALLAQPFSNSVATVYIVERPRVNGLPDHELAVAVDSEGDVGGLWYLNSAAGTWYTRGARGERDEVFYCHMGEERDFPADSEISIDLLRQGVREFLATGGERPTCVSWQSAGSTVETAAA